MASTVYPTGTTIYEPEKCWNGYTIFQPGDSGATLIDMNGNVVNQWRDLKGLPSANKILPGGYVMGTTKSRKPKYGFQDNVDLVQVDWDGNIVWRFNRYELVKDPRQEKTWMLRLPKFQILKLLRVKVLRVLLKISLLRWSVLVI